MTFRPNQAYIIAVLVFSLILSSCQTNTGLPTATLAATISGPTPPPETVTEVPPTAAPQNTPTLPPHLDLEQGQFGSMTIDFWHPWQGDLDRVAAEAVDEFNRSNEWGITVRARSLYSTGALVDTIREANLSEDTAPEVIAAFSEQLAFLSASKNSPVDLSGYVSHPQWGMSEAQVSAFNPVFWEQDLHGDIRLGIPALRTAPVLFYNQTWAKELGYNTPPTTPQEFKQQACAAAVANNQISQQDRHGTGGYLVDMSPATALSWLSAFGAQPVPQRAGQGYQFESEEGEEALAFLRGMFDQGCAWVGRNPEPFDYFARRMALFYSGSLSHVYPQKHIMESQKASDQWVVLPFPGQDGEPVVFASGYSYAVLPAKPEKQMAAWLFLRWMSDPVIQARMGEPVPSLPVSSAVIAQYADYQAHFPWDSIFPLAEQARPVPADAAWRDARRVLEDAFRQVFYLPADQVKTILPMVDETIEELQKRPVAP